MSALSYSNKNMLNKFLIGIQWLDRKNFLKVYLMRLKSMNDKQRIAIFYSINVEIEIWKLKLKLKLKLKVKLKLKLKIKIVKYTISIIGSY